LATLDGHGAAVDAALRLTPIVLLRGSPNTDSKPAPWEKLVVIAMVVVLLKIWPRRNCALAVNRVEWGAFAGSRS
jgi:hypothetical protein